jgi:hypothetical protein
MRAAPLPLAFAALAACAPPATEALVTISSPDLQVPADLDTIHIEVHAGGVANGPVLSSADVKPCALGESGDGCKRMPFTVLFVPGQSAIGSAWVDVVARAGGVDVIHDAFVLAFVPAFSLRYDLVLYRACEQTRCGSQGLVCGPTGKCAALAASNPPDLAMPASPSDLALADQPGPTTPRRIFLAGPHNGAFGGPAGAGLFCNQEAAKQPFSSGGFYVALLATSTADPVTWLRLDGGSRPIVRPDGIVVSTDDTFWLPHHMNTIDEFADKTVAAGLSNSVWTGFTGMGLRQYGSVATSYCNDWTDGSGGTSAAQGHADETGFGTANWAFSDISSACNGAVSVYCIEQ